MGFECLVGVIFGQRYVGSRKGRRIERKANVAR
jgi:hypothetical protein